MKTPLFPLLPLLLMASACQRYYYRPNAVNTPLFTGAGEAHAAATFGFANTDGSSGNNPYYHANSTFFNLQGAVSHVNHLAVLLNYSSFAYRTDVPDTFGNVNANAHLLEGAVGGYYAAGNKVKMVVDVFGGFGAGPIHSDIDAHISRFFVQPGIGMRSPAVDLAFNMRFSTVTYSRFNANGHSTYYLRGQGLIDSSGITVTGRSFEFYEPAFTLRTGYRILKVQMQMVLAQNLSLTPWSYNGFMYTAGIYFSLEEAIGDYKKHHASTSKVF